MHTHVKKYLRYLNKKIGSGQPFGPRDSGIDINNAYVYGKLNQLGNVLYF